MKNTTKEWLKVAEYDFSSAKVMLSSKRYLYVAFMCQQSIEKYIKAYLAETKSEMPPYTHNLIVLAKLAGLDFSETKLDFFSLLNRYYINARYPGVKEKLSKTLNAKSATDVYQETKEVVKCLTKELKMLDKRY